MLSPPAGSKRPYIELNNYQKLLKSVENSLEQYNLISDKVMNLVLFSFAIEHLCRIARMLKQTGGHVLTIGVGGSGRQSLTRLAS